MVICHVLVFISFICMRGAVNVTVQQVEPLLYIKSLINADFLMFTKTMFHIYPYWYQYQLIDIAFTFPMRDKDKNC